MQVSFIKHNRVDNIICDRCGAHIVNAFYIYFDDSYKMVVGSECLKKIEKQTNLNAYGTKVLHGYLNSIKRQMQNADKLEGITTVEQAKELEMWGLVQVVNGVKVHERTQEEFEQHRRFLLEKFYPAQLKRIESEIAKKLKGVKIREKTA